jgi:hypothetical protein
VCAYTALCYWTHGTTKCRVVGDLEDGYILTPVSEQHAACLDARLNPITTIPERAGRGRGDEERVIATFCRWLEGNGWSVRREVDVVDAVALRDGRTIDVEAKGRTSALGWTSILITASYSDECLRPTTPPLGSRWSSQMTHSVSANGCQRAFANYSESTSTPSRLTAPSRQSFGKRSSRPCRTSPAWCWSPNLTILQGSRPKTCHVTAEPPGCGFRAALPLVQVPRPAQGRWPGAEASRCVSPASLPCP